MAIPNISIEAMLAVIALATAVINHFRVSSVTTQVKEELKIELAAFKTELKADATLAAAAVLAEALVAGAKIKSEAKTAKENL